MLINNDLSDTIKNVLLEDLEVDLVKKYSNMDICYKDNFLAKDILTNKYLAPTEKSPIDMWLRIAWAAAQVEKENDRVLYAKQFMKLLFDWRFIPGGRINYGLGRNDINVSFSNCYVIPIEEDSLIGIYNCLKNEALTYKAGGGCGHDLSILRPQGASVVGSGGESCGPVGFMELYSVSTNTVAQNNRRGANMQTLIVSHPDIERFINVKNEAKQAIKILSDMLKNHPEDSASYKIILETIEKRRSVQYSNISVKLTDEFMNAVKEDSNFNLTFNNEVYKTIKAKELWNKIIKNAWESGEPGLMFWDRIKENANLDYCNPILTTNPCVSGDTLIAVADGRIAVSIKQLMEEGKDVQVYSIDNKGIVSIKTGRNPRITGYNQKLLRVTFDNGTTLDVTPEHKFLLFDKKTKEVKEKKAKDLKRDDILCGYFSKAKKLLENYNTAILSIEELPDEHTVYNITVDDNHNYAVVTNIYDEVICTGIYVTNCGELPLGKYGNCLLGHLNLTKFIKYGKDSNCFDFDAFKYYTSIAMRFLDNIITLNHGKHPLLEQNEISTNERRTGLGVTGLGDTFILLGVKYGSELSIAVTDMIFSTLRDSAYTASCDLAEEKGNFPWFDSSKYFISKFVNNLPYNIQNRIKTVGIRNGMLLTCAPVGSGSIIAETSSGIEPIFRKSFIRKVKNNDGNSYKEYTVYHPLVEKLFDISNIPNYVVDSSEIIPENRVMIQSVIQKYIDNSISSTVNLPKEASEEDVSKIYFNAWQLGCKGVTVYREGTREGVLISISKENKKEEPKRFVAKRPVKLKGETYKLKIDITGEKPYNCYVTVNFSDDTNNPHEILVTETNANKDFKDIMALETTTRLISLALRHGVPIKFIIEQLEKINCQYIYSLPISIANILRNYLVVVDDEEDNIGEKCPSCGEFTLIMENGCSRCLSCIYSKCS